MTIIGSIGLGMPPYEISQEEVKKIIENIFPLSERKLNRYLPVFDHALIKTRQLVVKKDWFFQKHTFEEKNKIYEKYAKKLSLTAVDHCLSNEEFLRRTVPYEAIDMIIYISSTGIATPSIDVHIMNDRSFRNDVIRLPVWGLGCAGGAMGLSHAFNFLRAYPDKNVLIICCELCSITFQKEDQQKSNLIGTALFGDGVSAVLMIGDISPYQEYLLAGKPKILQTNSMTKKHSTDVMGWDVTNEGLKVIFSKSIPALVHSFWQDHAKHFLRCNSLQIDDIHSYIAHPGGKKVLEAMEESLTIPKEKLHHSYSILKHHGNMSSATVLYVLYEWMKEEIKKDSYSILSSLGPGFSSELLLLKWGE